MTLNSRLRSYKDEAVNIENSKDYSYKVSSIVNLAQRAFTDGVISIMNKKNTSNLKEAVGELNEDISEYYLDKNIETLNEYLMALLREYTKNGKLIIGYEDLIVDDFKNIVKAVYDMGFIGGVSVGQDPNKLAIYLKNKDKLEDGTY